MKMINTQLLFSGAISLSLIACSSLSAEEAVVKASGKPQWINQPESACTPFELCGVGEGTGLMGAEAHARKALALVFKTKIQSESTSTKASSQTGGDAIVTSDVKEESSFFVKEVTDKLIEGAQVKERYEDKDKVYVLVALKKRVAAQRVQSEIDILDQKMLALKKEGTRGALNKIPKLWEIREELNSDYQFLAGEKMPTVVDLQDVGDMKKAFQTKPQVIKVQVFGADTSGAIKAQLQQALIDNGFKVVTDDRDTEVTLKANVQVAQLFMKVAGFEKHQFTFSLHSLNKEGEKVGSLSQTILKTGRNYAQAEEQALIDFRAYLSEHLSDLNLE